jgi:hypothetical protein
MDIPMVTPWSHGIPFLDLFGKYRMLYRLDVRAHLVETGDPVVVSSFSLGLVVWDLIVAAIQGLETFQPTRMRIT